MIVVQTKCSFSPLSSFQAMIGVAFSLGFLFGPIIGAMFSVLGKKTSATGSFTTFQYPALFALALAIADIIFLLIAYKETLPKEKRVR